MTGWSTAAVVVCVSITLGGYATLQVPSVVVFHARAFFTSVARAFEASAKRDRTLG
jgi:hypothetical protein